MNLLADMANYWALRLWSVSLQVTILVALVYGLALCLRRLPARYRYLLWLVVLVRLAVPATFLSPLGIGQYPERLFTAALQWVSSSAAPQSTGSHAPATRPESIDAAESMSGEGQIVLPQDDRIRSAAMPLSLAWLSGVLLLGLLVGIRVIQVRRSAGAFRPVDRPDLVALLRRLASQVGLRRKVRLLQADLSGSLPIPAVHGVVRPAIVIPSGMAAAWALDALEPVLLHELVHIKRRDCLVNSAQIALQVVYFFHPMVWLANWAIRRERELACDDEVVRRSGGKSTAYVRSMLRVAETVAHQPRRQRLGMAMAENTSNLGRRIRRMMHASYRATEKYALSYAFIVLAAGFLCVAVSAQGWERTAAMREEMVSAAPEAPAIQNPVGTSIPERKEPKPKAVTAPAAAVSANPAPKAMTAPAAAVAVSPAPKAVTAPAPVVAANPAPKPQRTEPVRVGNAVQESKLKDRVDPVMPQGALQNRIAGMVMLEVIVDEAGVPASLRVVLGAPLFEEAAIAAVRQWRYSPTRLNGEPVPVQANVVLGFGLPNKIVVDQEGNLRSGDGLPVSLDNIREIQGTIVLTPEQLASFAAVERAVKTLQEKGVQNIQLISMDFIFKAGRLFYLTRPIAGVSGAVAGVPGGITGGVIGGVPGGVARGVPGGVVGGVPGGVAGGVVGGTVGGVAGGVGEARAGEMYSIQLPELIFDLDSLRDMAKANSTASAQSTKTPSRPAASLSYRVFVNEAGQVVAVERLTGPDVPEIAAALLQARVLTPGYRSGIPVPVAIVVNILPQ